MNHILIAEADPMVAHIIQTYLFRIENVRVHGPASSFEEITAILKKEQIGLILLDAYLPKRSGLEVLRLLRENGYYEGVVMVTAANTVLEVKKAYAYGALDYIIKPFQISRLDRAIKKHLNIVEKIKGKVTLTQEDMDCEDTIEKHIELPKGLNRTTYNRILEKLNEYPKKEWTLRQLATEVQISNVTIKKYIDYLVQTGIVEVSLIYGNVGRPEFRIFLRT